jgi:hypothetical protein
MVEVHSFAVQTFCPRKENRSILRLLNEGNTFFGGRWESSLEDVTIRSTWMIIVNTPKFIHPSQFHAIF